jgi:hypothetical protein
MRLSRWVALALGLLVPLPGCGGSPGGNSEFVESLVRLLSARFVPASVVVPRGASRTVDFEVTCDNAGLNTVFGRLSIRVKLDPERRLPEGVTAVFVDPSPPDASGFRLYPCNGTHADPNLRIAHLPVRVQAAGNVAPATVTLVGYVEVEPLTTGTPSKDSTLADLPVMVVVGEGTSPAS